ncbi:TPA: hypothetical protein HIF43_004176 [Escherichia coli]|uniref:hypothetical protein n=1 Tax=Escherichia coli TaxID=562 RepID=UPI0002C8BD40|nr:hypothetical protein [Escherichia coli]ENE04296.1 hypothetical protein ECP03047993_3401 [Escherichia coli P0304799.3]HAH9728811.1 hypothetical protein [Escherichia coli]
MALIDNINRVNPDRMVFWDWAVNHFFLPDILQVSPALLLLFLYQGGSGKCYFQQQVRDILVLCMNSINRGGSLSVNDAVN